MRLLEAHHPIQAPQMLSMKLGSWDRKNVGDLWSRSWIFAEIKIVEGGVVEVFFSIPRSYGILKPTGNDEKPSRVVEVFFMPQDSLVS